MYVYYLSSKSLSLSLFHAASFNNQISIRRVDITVVTPTKSVNSSRSF